jgi:hypothetical protein
LNKGLFRFDFHRLIAIFSITLSLLVFAGHLAMAQSPTPVPSLQIQLNATAAFQGQFKYGEWLPVWVEITNSGPDVQAEIRIPVSGGSGTMVFTAPVELPAGAHKKLLVYILPNNFTRQLSIELASGDQMLASQRVDVHPNPNVNYLVGLAAPERGALAQIASIKPAGLERTKVLVDFDIAELPDQSEGLRSFDLLVINNLDTSKLTPEQAQALESWVAQGGRLLVGGGAGAQITTAGLSTGLFPAEIQATTEIEAVPGLVDYVGDDKPVRVPGPFLAAQIQSKTGRVIIKQDQIPLLTEWSVGTGFVDFSALDPAAAPFDAWNGTIAFWQNLLAPSAVYPDWLPTDISSRQQFASNMPYALSNLPMLELPSASWLALMLGVYILMVGPVNYLVLRQMKRLQLAWITIPSITIFFSIVSFLLGYALHGTDIFVNKIAVIQVASGGSAHIDSYIGVFSPAQTAYEVEIREAGLISPLSPFYDPWNSAGNPGNTLTGHSMIIVQGNPAYVRGLSIDQWSMQSFMSEGIITSFGTFDARLQVNNDRLVGTIRNSTAYNLKDCYVILGSKFAKLGDLAPGTEAQVELDLSSLGAPNFSSPLSYAMFDTQLNGNVPNDVRRQAEAKRSIIENLFERTTPFISAAKSPSAGSTGLSQAPMFAGWMEEAPPQVKIFGAEPAQKTTALVLTPLTYSLSDSSGTITLPPGLVPGRLTASPRDGGTCGAAGATAVYISHGEAIFEFNLPAEANALQVQNLKLGIWTDSGFFNIPVVEVYNWKSNDWTKLAGVSQGTNLIPGAGSLVRSDGLVQVRLSSDGAQSCYYLALGLEGLLP